MKAIAGLLAVSWPPAQSQLGPGHHLRLPKGATARKLVLVLYNFRYGGGIAEITQQLFGEKRSLVRADKFQDV